MAIPLPGDTIFKVTAKFLLHGNACWNVYYFRDVGGGTDPFLAAGIITTELENWIYPTLSVELEPDVVTIQRIWPTVGDPLDFPWTTPAVRVSGEAVPNQVCLVVTHTTGNPGRRARGRTYLPGVLETQFDGTTGKFFAAYAAARGTNFISLVGSIGAQYEMCLWSTKSLVGPSPQYYPLTNSIGRAIPAIQRRRRLGVGI